jgi:hypothetical protein
VDRESICSKGDVVVETLARFPTCSHEDTPGQESTRCVLLANYIVLDPPLVYKRIPTPVWLPGEARTKARARRKPQPLYCREHAYKLCNLEPSPLSSPF